MPGLIEYLFGENPTKKSKKGRNRKSKKDKKSKKNRENSLTRKQKKQLTDDYYEQYLNRYFARSYKDKDLDVSSIKYKDYKWGLGAEHEMQLFHISKSSSDKGITESKIIFDSQESTCLLTYRPGDKVSKNGTCCKKLKPICYHEHSAVKKLIPKKQLINDKDIKWLKTVPWELSGRQCDKCDKILPRVPVLMPEIITGNHKNRTIESICDELIFMEHKFIDLQMKNPYTKQKVKKYGEIRQLPYGAISDIKIPEKPTSHMKNYKFKKEKYTDYLGSFHVTITLPHRKKTSNRRFIEVHQNFANQFQWIEPLLITSFFSGDPNNVISKDKKIRGSYRVMVTGWGNLAGSDLRKLSKKGVGRYANIESRWRDKINVKEVKPLMKCEDMVMIDEPGAVGILSSNVRTFGFDHTDKCKGHECPKVSGAPMVKPNGIEFRIFDHFNSKHLVDLMRIMVYTAENSSRHLPKGYVYTNKAWLKTTQDVMEQGWKAIVSEDYVKELNKNLGLDLVYKPKKAYGLLIDVVKKLYEKNKDGVISKIMLRDEYKEPPKLPQINRFSWQIQFNKEYGKKIRKFVDKKMVKGKELSINDFESLFYRYFEKSEWKRNLTDVLYALEVAPNNLLKLGLEKGKIKRVTKL
jgi:hypothetical protein